MLVIDFLRNKILSISENKVKEIKIIFKSGKYIIKNKRTCELRPVRCDGDLRLILDDKEYIFSCIKDYSYSLMTHPGPIKNKYMNLLLWGHT
jgi:hypothetical protein